jgi:tRNA (guanine26-N2/guanine27-N2)-dimethyltransferase
MNAGYKVSGTHCVAGAFKTNAPSAVVWDVMKTWKKQQPVRPEKQDAETNSIAAKILAVPTTYILVVTEIVWISILHFEMM